MLISNAKKDETGDWNFDLDLKAEEVDFLVNFATQILLSEGMVSIKEQVEEQEVQLPQEMDNKPNAPSSITLN
jgi:hypothetical protein